MGGIVLDASKVNSYVLSNLVKSKNTMQDAYSTSQSLRNSLPNSFTYKSTINDIVNQLYNIKKEISDVNTIISKKMEKAKSIENKNDNRASSLARAASKVGSMAGAVGGAVIGARAGGIVGAAAGAYVGKKVGSSLGKGIVDTGAKVVKSVTSLCKKIKTNIKNIQAKVVRKVSSLVSKVAKKLYKIPQFYFKTKAKIENKIISSVENITGWDLNWLKKINTKVSNFVVSVIDKIGNLASGLIKNLGNWYADLIQNPLATIRKTRATLKNLSISLAEGLISFLEAVVDVAALVVGCSLSHRTLVIDLYNGIKSGDWDWSETGTVWKKYIMPFVTTDWTSKGFDKLYELKPFKDINNNAYTWAQRGNVGYTIGKGAGYYAGVIALSFATCGAAAGAVGATSASSAAATQVVGGVTLKTFTTAGSIALGAFGQNTQKNFIKINDTAKKEGVEVTGKDIFKSIGKAGGKAIIEGGVFLAAGAAGDTLSAYGDAIKIAKEIKLPVKKSVDIIVKNKHNIQTAIKASKGYISEGYSWLVDGEKYNFGEATIDAASIVVAEKAAYLFTNPDYNYDKVMYKVPKDSTLAIKDSSVVKTKDVEELTKALGGSMSQSSKEAVKVGLKETAIYAGQNAVNKAEEKAIKIAASDLFEEIVS